MFEDRTKNELVAALEAARREIFLHYRDRQSACATAPSSTSWEMVQLRLEIEIKTTRNFLDCRFPDWDKPK